MDAVRRLLAAGMILAAVIGLLPMVPLVFGYYSATVGNNSAGTFYPAAAAAPTYPFVKCWQDPSPLVAKKNSADTGSFRMYCTNNWVSAVAVQVTLFNNAGSGFTISPSPVDFASINPGVTACRTVNYSVPKDSGSDTIVYQGVANPGNAAADLYAVIQYRAVVSYTGTGNPPDYVCP